MWPSGRIDYILLLVATVYHNHLSSHFSDSGIVMVDGTFFGDSFEQDRSWDDSGTTISGI